MNPYEYIILKQTLMRFFQGKNVKVSIFIQDELQSNTGIIFIPMNETAPPAVKKPGMVMKYHRNGEVDNGYNIPLKLSQFYEPSKIIERVNVITTELGGNIYLGNKKKNLDESLANEQQKTVQNDKSSSNSINNVIKNTNTSQQTITKNSNSNVGYSYLKDTQKRKENVELIKKEFGQLSDLLGVNKNKNESLIFKFDLFKNSSSNNAEINSNKNDVDDFIEIEREKENINLDKIKNMFDDFTVKEDNTNNNENEYDDLLDLMDMAANK